MAITINDYSGGQSSARHSLGGNPRHADPLKSVVDRFGRAVDPTDVARDHLITIQGVQLPIGDALRLGVLTLGDNGMLALTPADPQQAAPYHVGAPLRSTPAGQAYAQLEAAIGPAHANAYLARVLNGGTPPLDVQEMLGAAVGGEASLKIQAALHTATAQPMQQALASAGLDPAEHGHAFETFTKQRGFHQRAVLSAVHESDEVHAHLATAADAYALDVRRAEAAAQQK